MYITYQYTCIHITIGLKRRLEVVSPALLRRVPWQILEDQPPYAPTMGAGARAAHATAERQDRFALCWLDHGSSTRGSSTAAAAVFEGELYRRGAASIHHQRRVLSRVRPHSGVCDGRP